MNFDTKLLTELYEKYNEELLKQLGYKNNKPNSHVITYAHKIVAGENFKEQLENEFSGINRKAIFDGIVFDEDNFNPYHEKEYTGEVSQEEFISKVSEALKILKAKTPKTYKSIKPFLDTIGICDELEDKETSLSYEPSLGIIYVSYNKDPILIADAIIHEVAHTILHILHRSDEIVLNDYENKYYSSAQDRPRPLAYCYLALHAFTHVMNFYLELDDPKYLDKLFASHAKCISLISIVKKYSEFTDIGKLMFADMKETLEDQKIKEKIKDNETRYMKIQEEANKHFLVVKEKYPEILA